MGPPRHRVADQHPELVISKQAIIEKLEGRAGPQARKLFEKFVRDLSVCGYVSFFEIGFHLFFVRITLLFQPVKD